MAVFSQLFVKIVIIVKKCLHCPATLNCALKTPHGSTFRVEVRHPWRNANAGPVGFSFVCVTALHQKKCSSACLLADAGDHTSSEKLRF